MLFNLKWHQKKGQIITLGPCLEIPPFCPVYLFVRVAGGSRGKADYLLEKGVGRGWSGGLPSLLFDSVFLNIKGRTLKDHKRDCHPGASFHMLDHRSRVVTLSSLVSFLPWHMDQQAVSRDRVGVENHTGIDPLKCFLNRGHCLPETASNPSPQITLVQVRAACRGALHTSCGIRWNICLWGFTPWDVGCDQDNKPSPANISPGKNTHLNFYMVSVTLAHMWIYLSF